MRMEPVIRPPEIKRKEKIPFEINNCNKILFFENEKDRYVLSMDIHAMKKNNIEITAKKNILNIFSKEDTSHIDKIISVNNRCIYYMHQLDFSFTLPTDADVKMGKAKCCGETLIISFPKKIQPFCPSYLKIPVT
jgi:HSP20 family molecular chaperone IbpA